MLVDQDQLRFLKKNELFKGVPEKYLKTFLLLQNLIEVKDGTILYSCEEDASELYLVIEGEVKIKFCKEKNIEYKILFDFFGEAEILKENKRFSFAVVNSDCILYKMSISELKHFCGLSKRVSENLNKKSGQEINEYAEGETPDLNLTLDYDTPTKEEEIIDFDQKKEKELINELTEEDPDDILEKQRTKNKLGGDLNDIPNFDNEDLDDLSLDSSGKDE